MRCQVAPRSRLWEHWVPSHADKVLSLTNHLLLAGTVPTRWKWVQLASVLRSNTEGAWIAASQPGTPEGGSELRLGP